jgi:hypothetical protein
MTFASHAIYTITYTATSLLIYAGLVDVVVASILWAVGELNFEKKNQFQQKVQASLIRAYSYFS